VEEDDVDDDVINGTVVEKTLLKIKCVF